MDQAFRQAGEQKSEKIAQGWERNPFLRTPESHRGSPQLAGRGQVNVDKWKVPLEQENGGMGR